MMMTAPRFSRRVIRNRSRREIVEIVVVLVKRDAVRRRTVLPVVRGPRAVAVVLVPVLVLVFAACTRAVRRARGGGTRSGAAGATGPPRRRMRTPPPNPCAPPPSQRRARAGGDGGIGAPARGGRGKRAGLPTGAARPKSLACCARRTRLERASSASSAHVAGARRTRGRNARTPLPSSGRATETTRRRLFRAAARLRRRGKKLFRSLEAPDSRCARGPVGVGSRRASAGFGTVPEPAEVQARHRRGGAGTVLRRDVRIPKGFLDDARLFAGRRRAKTRRDAVVRRLSRLWSAGVFKTRLLEKELGERRLRLFALLHARAPRVRAALAPLGGGVLGDDHEDVPDAARHGASGVQRTDVAAVLDPAEQTPDVAADLRRVETHKPAREGARRE